MRKMRQPSLTRTLLTCVHACMQSLDLSFNSIHGRVPDALLGLSTGKNLATLKAVRLFRQKGQRLCAHLTRVPPGSEDFAIDGFHLHHSLSALQGRRAALGTQTCRSANVDGLAVSFKAAVAVAPVELFAAGTARAPGGVALFRFPPAVFEANATVAPLFAEAFLGVCDLPEMMALQCASPPFLLDVAGIGNEGEASMSRCEAVTSHCLDRGSFSAWRNSTLMPCTSSPHVRLQVDTPP
jgi:hypothetical protein